MKIAAIDIGSNSIHLVVMRASPGRHLEIIEREKDMARLGAGTLRDHRLSKETIERAINTLRRFKQVADSLGADVILATATAAVREADNSEEFIETVKKQVGIDIRLLPGVEEARLIALAVAEAVDFNNRRGLIIDIGGGSTEFIVTAGKEPEVLFSLRVGSVRLTEKFITTDPISEKERARLVAAVRGELVRPAPEILHSGFDFAIGTSGTIHNLVGMAAELEKNGPDPAPGFEGFSRTMTLDQLRKLNRRLTRMSERDRARVPGIDKGRADIIVAGGLLLETLMSELGAKNITTCDWSLREGAVLDYIRNHGMSELVRGGNGRAPASPEEQSACELIGAASLDVRTRTVLSVARRYNYDAKHSHHVARLATVIFDRTRAIHKMGDEERRLLQYAALLHDIGHHIAHNNHHHHSLYLIKHSEMPGFTGGETALLGTIVRYHRGSIPKKLIDKRTRVEHEGLLFLEKAQRQQALGLAAILQLADALDRSYQQAVHQARCEVAGKVVTISIDGEGDLELELWSGDRKAKPFREIFDVEVEIKRITIP
jgi:exopolyphosphatase/guanosine-5'-triphosphate,3'-diphosphate pyrophosphatase